MLLLVGLLSGCTPQEEGAPRVSFDATSAPAREGVAIA
jgi:hypothetical protein